MITWEELEKIVNNCQRCELCRSRHNVVLGVGNRNADIMFVGEGPSYHEDMQGEPFVDPAGKLLDKMLASIGLDRQKVYIANVVKCRPPGNRDPLPEERAFCLNYLRVQYMLVNPKIIVCLGRIAAISLISPDFSITRSRGKWIYKKGVEFTATYHPSALLRDESKKRLAWEDLKSIREKLNELENK
ncbi:MAG: uracil-DNA glycosylase [Clostridiales bacterium]|nr:uracil-DNA glycosylase [Clostridiales bacterium]